MVPRTEIVRLAAASFNYGRRARQAGAPLPEKTGSLQLFVAGCRQASSLLGGLSLARPLTLQAASLLAEFQRMAVLDYLIRNTGRRRLL